METQRTTLPRDNVYAGLQPIVERSFPAASSKDLGFQHGVASESRDCCSDFLYRSRRPTTGDVDPIFSKQALCLVLMQAEVPFR